MSQIDQNNAMLSLENALVPKSTLIDGRTETDQLRMLVDFASLFNFYDRTNTINGNWSPFLLKDPVFLVASIAKTAFQKAYTLFINTCLQLETSLQKDLNTAFISNGFNQLFDQLTSVFQTIEQWTYYMQQSSLEYNLKTYIIQQVKEKQSAILWALLSLKNDLFSNDIIPNIKPVDTFIYEKYNKKIWKESKGKRPYWELLNLQLPPKDEYIVYFFKDFIILIKKLEALLKGSSSNITKEIFTIIEDAHVALLKVLDIFFSVSEALIEKVIDFIKDVAAFVHQIIHQIRAELKVHLENFENEDIFETIDTVLTDLDALQDILKSTSGKYSYTGFKALIIAILKALEAIVIAIADILIKFGTLALDIVNAIFEGIASTFEEIGKELYAALKALINYILTKQVRSDIYNGLKRTGKSLFGFYSNCISYASTELETIKNVPGHFPDTVLLRTFTSLLGIYQTQLNSLSEKHLNFYYGDILKQLPKSVTADTVFTCCQLTKSTTTFQLPKNTVFNAGIAENKQPILFETTKTTSLNPAKIVTTYTLTQGYDTSLYLQKLPPVNVVKKDESGTVQKWKTFGSQIAPKGNKQYMSLAFGSPMFYLSEAKKRKIILVFTLSNSNASDISENNTVCYLSTKKAWFEIPQEEICVEQQSNIVTLTITLAQTDPAITAFTKNPDGYTCDWPIFKMDFLNNNDFANPTEIKTLEVHVDVTELQNFQLYNDFGLLNAKKPFQPLGPAPIKEESFMVGSNEIFSKPIDTLSIAINWNVFPDGFDFSTYYCQYNNYLKGLYSKPVTSDSDQTAIICPKKVTLIVPENENDKEQKATSFFGRIFGISSKKVTSEVNDSIFQFKNNAFKVSFSFLENGLWKPIENPETTQELFTVNNSIVPIRTFDFTSFQTTIDSNLQKTSLQLSNQSITGFLKMQLVAPDIGFGTTVYANVVAAIALYNAGVIAEKIKDSTSPLILMNPPNLPFIPVINLFSGNYTASKTYDFSSTKETYPLECFYNTPFQNYKVYDTTCGIITENTTLGSLLNRDDEGKIIPLTALPLIPKFSSEGQLFLELENVIAPAELSFYFELAREYTDQTDQTHPITFSYLSKNGWKSLIVIADGTNDFTCSGIITLNIPQDITTNHETMPGKNFWIAIGTENTTDGYAQTTFLKTNGITLKRVVSTTDFSANAPQIKALTITGPKNTIPAIATTLQPFPSFGGKASETKQQMNVRVSTRLKTKDRLVTAEDYFNVIRFEFPEVYYSKTNYDNTLKKVITYVAKRVSDATNASAFEPLLSECKELEIQEYIQDRVSAFRKVTVSNFILKYIKITADIKVDSTYEVTTIAKKINNEINVFLSPWITSAQSQITIDKGINTSQIAAFINSFESVLEVNSISFQIGTKYFATGEISYGTTTQEFIPTSGTLIVPSLNNLTTASTISYHL